MVPSDIASQRWRRHSSSDVHVWHVGLNQDAAVADWLITTLSPDELARAERFHFARDRRRFVIARGVLRILVGRYCGMSPADVGFVYNEHGKPAIDPAHRPAPLRFNLAHSQDLALVALSVGRELGIDVEYRRPIPDAESIAARYFSPAEQAALRALPAAEREVGFYSCWTRKEAYLKARGDGLSVPLDSFDVSVGLDAPACLLQARHNPGDVRRWSLRSLPVAGAYIAALAVEGHGWQLHTWRWTPQRTGDG